VDPNRTGSPSRKAQSVISRIEAIEAGKGLTLQTLLDIGSGFDLPLLVEYVGWEEWFDRMYRVSATDLCRRAFDPSHLSGIARNNQKSVGQDALNAFISYVPQQAQRGPSAQDAVPPLPQLNFGVLRAPPPPAANDFSTLPERNSRNGTLADTAA
jgi:hypothetical protein